MSRQNINYCWKSFCNLTLTCIVNNWACGFVIRATQVYWSGTGHVLRGIGQSLPDEVIKSSVILSAPGSFRQTVCKSIHMSVWSDELCIPLQFLLCHIYCAGFVSGAIDRAVHMTAITNKQNVSCLMLRLKLNPLDSQPSVEKRCR